MNFEEVSKAADRIKAFAKLELGDIEDDKGVHPFLIIAWGESKTDQVIAQTPLAIRSNIGKDDIFDALRVALAMMEQKEQSQNL